MPVSSSFYYEARPNIAIAKTAALPLDGDWGLAPALADTIHPLWLKGQATFVPFAGTHDTTRSHFETQDHIELGQPDDGSAFALLSELNRSSTFSCATIAAPTPESRIAPAMLPPLTVLPAARRFALPPV